MKTNPLQRAAESIIFAAEAPVPPEQIAEIVAEVTGRPPSSVEEVRAAVDDLNASYEADGRALRIEQWAEGYRMATAEDVAPFVNAYYVGEQRTTLSRSLMETIAIVAYRQPVTRPEVDFVRGVNSDYALRRLMELDLVDVQGRSDAVGRPLLYGTTDHFLEEFGLNDLGDLPTIREVREILDDPSFDEERAKLLQLDAEAAVAASASGPASDDAPTDDARPDDDRSTSNGTANA
ncbi:SMC-Scp complex subunit ScpB [Salisaeta longa]|uniref:SMC-Scp complex subunit ScpB n=1 Tax=Salisaeta longa TaxID=503170 RepID=UPI0003B5F417|nr:SMC-Scp complex subunit ScpB [Salisaeta longa]